MTVMIDPLSQDETVATLIDLMARAKAANEEAPLLFANQDIVEQWVLVPRAHLRTIESWYGEVDEVKAITMITDILADARLLGLKEDDDAEAP
jgi:hypothetical protein